MHYSAVPNCTGQQFSRGSQAAITKTVLGELTPEEIDEQNKLTFESCSWGGHNSTMTQWLKLVRPNLSKAEIKQLIADGIKYESFSPKEQTVISQNQSTLGQNSVTTRWLKLVRPNLYKVEIKQLITDGIKYENLTTEERSKIRGQQCHSTRISDVEFELLQLDKTFTIDNFSDEEYETLCAL
jgi:hypothetical protein